MEKLPSDKVRAIGVSNFSIRNLKKLLKTAKVVPAANQVNAAFLDHFIIIAISWPFNNINVFCL